MKMMNFSRVLLIIAGLLLSASAFAEYVVIVNPGNTSPIEKKDLENLYLGKTKAFPNGNSAHPVNQQEAAAIRTAFDTNIVGKTGSQMKSYWAKLVFTGKAVPIKEVASDAEVISTVANDPAAIGYIDSKNVDGSVKVVTEF